MWFGASIGMLAAAVLVSTNSAYAEDVSTLLRLKTQQFSDAGKQGDKAAMARLLDERVVFFNELGRKSWMRARCRHLRA